MTEKAVTRFETCGDLTSTLLDKSYRAFMARYKHPWVHRVLVGVIALESVALAVLKLMNGEGIRAVSGVTPLLMVAAIYLLMNVLINWISSYGAKMTVRRFEEETPSGIAAYTVAFSDAQVHLQNHANGASGAIALSNMKRLMQVEDIWVLVTKTGAFVPVFVSQLSETDRESVLQLLKQNNPKIKIQLKRKK